jgi:hypothetical protein
VTAPGPAAAGGNGHEHLKAKRPSKPAAVGRRRWVRIKVRLASWSALGLLTVGAFTDDPYWWAASAVCFTLALEARLELVTFWLDELVTSLREFGRSS